MTTVRTVADKRVVAEQGVVLNQYVGPLNWEHYKIPASGKSNSQLTFANLVTLGTNRIYDSNFQIEYTISVQFNDSDFSAAAYPTVDKLLTNIRMHPFPLHWVTDQLRTNINGAACMVRPQESLFQRMMYWRNRVLDKTCSFCPHDKCPVTEDRPLQFETPAYESTQAVSAAALFQDHLNHQMQYGKNGSQHAGLPLPCVNATWDTTTKTVNITIREPVLCPPFNQRLDEIYQSPLFNVTSIDMVYQLNDLRKMFVSNDYYLMDMTDQTATLEQWHMNPSTLSVNILDANLCFNVASMPPGMTVPPILQLPYYDNVCYVTKASDSLTSASTGEHIFVSGVYTLAQVPTAIYIFVSENQLYRSTADGSTDVFEPSLSPIRNINITMGNNTQLLTTTSEYDRYQMALANGLEDVTWEEFTKTRIPFPRGAQSTTGEAGVLNGHGNKCILRLIPGVDLLIPDKRLVGGTDAEQMVFQVRLTADITDVPPIARDKLCLWIMFEYVGTLTIEPVHAAIDMLPLKTIPPIGTPDAVTVATVDAASGGGEGTNPTGAGIFDIIGLVRKGYGLAKKAWNSSIGKAIRGVADRFLDPSGSAPIAPKNIRLAPDAEIPGHVDMGDETVPLPKTGGRIYGGSIIGGDVLGKYYK